MAVETPGAARTSFDLKSTQLPVVAVVLKSGDGTQIEAEFRRQLDDDQSFFDDDLVVIDLAAVRDETRPIDFAALVALLKEHRTRPVAVRGGSAGQMQAAFEAGLAAAPEMPRRPAPAPVEAVHEVPEARGAQELPAAPVPTLVIDKPVRSGQQIYARGGDLVVLAIVNFGAEVIADGSIHIYGPLRGRALAGAQGNEEARIFCREFHAELVAVAGHYKVLEDIQQDLRGKAVQVWLENGHIKLAALD